MGDEDPLEQCEGFDWDNANIEKNWTKHGVLFWECEEVFFNEPLIVTQDMQHSVQEDRYYALGKISSDRLLFVVFTVRKNLVRVISARNMTRKEKRIYEQSEEESSDL